MLFMSIFFFFKQKTAYEMRISDWSSDVCSSDLPRGDGRAARPLHRVQGGTRLTREMPTALAKSTLSSRHSLPGPHGFATNSSSPSALSRESRAGARTVALDPGSRSLCSLVRGDGQREATEIYARRREDRKSTRLNSSH